MNQKSSATTSSSPIIGLPLKGQQQEPKLPLFRVLPPYGYSTPEMDAAINRYIASKAEK